ncbi:unnamed protein product [Phytophthora lilii]|uniref:Unnamed protein product n=1 Tax=Phytophthora lilii TaxID=2077276 RepID=A0A9W6UAS2_9STRA|nr:unnamed protein product [Phytophthora lilii]
MGPVCLRRGQHLAALRELRLWHAHVGRLRRYLLPLERGPSARAQAVRCGVPGAGTLHGVLHYRDEWGYEPIGRFSGEDVGHFRRRRELGVVCVAAGDDEEGDSDEGCNDGADYYQCDFLTNTTVWTVFAFADDDIFVVVPNAIGMLVCIVQVVLYILYPPSSSKEALAEGYSDVDYVGICRV